MQSGRYAAIGGVPSGVSNGTSNMRPDCVAGNQLPGGANSPETMLLWWLPRLFDGGEASFLRGIGLVGAYFPMAFGFT